MRAKTGTIIENNLPFGFAVVPVDVQMIAKKVDRSITSIFGISTFEPSNVSNDNHSKPEQSKPEQSPALLQSTDALYHGPVETDNHSKTQGQPLTDSRESALEARKNDERIGEKKCLSKIFSSARFYLTEKFQVAIL